MFDYKVCNQVNTLILSSKQSLLGRNIGFRFGMVAVIFSSEAGRVPGRLPAAIFSPSFPFIMHTFPLLLWASGLGLGVAQAQTSFSFGPRLGGNLSTATFNTLAQATVGNSTASISRNSLAGFQVGVAASIGNGPWLVQPALMFSQKGLKQSATATDTFGNETITESLSVTSRVNFLELPVNVVYAFGADGHGFQVFAGPYLAMGVGGKAEYTYAVSSTDPTSFFNGQESGSTGYSFGNTFAEPDPNPNPNGSTAELDARARRFDAGLNLGVGYRTGPVQVQLGYAIGLLNAQPDYPASYQLKNDTGYHRNAQLTATYFLPSR